MARERVGINVQVSVQMHLPKATGTAAFFPVYQRDHVATGSIHNLHTEQRDKIFKTGDVPYERHGKTPACPTVMKAKH